jgi:hypothetical protein
VESPFACQNSYVTGYGWRPGSTDELALLGLDPVPRRPAGSHRQAKEETEADPANSASRYTLYRTDTKYRSGQNHFNVIRVEKSLIKEHWDDFIIN